jgi:predicted ABC-type exoprotein transport system permease subunit
MDLSFVFNDPLVLGFLVILLGFVLFMYLFVRRTITGFREGVQNGRR